MARVKPFVSYVKLKKWGRYYAVLTLLLGFAAVNSGNNLLYFFLAALLSIMALSGFFSYLSLKSIRLSIIVPEEIYAKTVNYLKIRVSNRNIVPVFLIYVKKSDKEKVLFDMIPPKSYRESLMPYYFERRGYSNVDAVFAGTTFPLSFTIREMYYPLNLKVLVFPHIYRIRHEDRSLYPKNAGWGAQSTKEGAIGDFMGLRKYEKHDSVSRIYWKKVKNKDLFVKRFHDEDFKEFTLEISSRASESEIEKVASMAVYYLENGHSVGLSVDGKEELPPDSGMNQKIRILEKLALLSYED
jgi:uncharacterized protein (DUF58 family)